MLSAVPRHPPFSFPIPLTVVLTSYLVPCGSQPALETAGLGDLGVALQMEEDATRQQVHTGHGLSYSTSLYSYVASILSHSVRVQTYQHPPMYELSLGCLDSQQPGTAIPVQQKPVLSIMAFFFFELTMVAALLTQLPNRRYCGSPN